MHARTRLIRENALQAHLIKEVRAAGGFAVKITSPSRRGMPDVLIIWKGAVLFVEVKMNMRSKPTALQTLAHREMRAAGAKVTVLTGLEEVDNYLIFILGITK
jgi:Holliday junction resolvase